MKKRFLFLLLILFTGSLFAQKKVLKFNANGSFKIIQFTDVHYNPEKEKESAVAIQLINEVLDAEKPDLVVFSGDIIFGKPVLDGLERVFEPVVKRQIPWAYVLGNHDDEFGVSRRELMDFAISKPYCLAQHGDECIKGTGNYVLEVKGSEVEDLKAILYFMDSGAYSNIKSPFSYAWFDFSQVDWYRKQSAAYTKRNENNSLPALAFFHIPLPEYSQMTSAKDSVLVGEKREKECSPQLNTGMFTAMREASDVMGTFVGHDHDNDYIGAFYDIYLAYGRFSGGNTVYNNLGLNGCRVIELAEDKREFNTYIRLIGGQKLYEVNYPSTFLKKEEDKK